MNYGFGGIKKFMRIFLDDERNPTGLGWKIIRTAEEAIKLIKTGKVTEISFDHDLGQGKSGYDVARFIEEGAFNGNIKRIIWTVHSFNPVGSKNIIRAMKSADRFWDREKIASKLLKLAKEIIN